MKGSNKLTVCALSVLLTACGAVIQRPVSSPVPIISDNSLYLDSANNNVSVSGPSEQNFQAPLIPIFNAENNPRNNPQGSLATEVLSVAQKNGEAAFVHFAQANQNSQGNNNSGEIPQFYTVQAGDNLFRIATRFGLNYREIADLNNINPDALSIGQVILLRPLAQTSQMSRVGGNISTPSALKTPIQQQAGQQNISQVAKNPEGKPRWPRPTDGNIVETFNPPSSRGIKFEGTEGQAIRAVNDGKVVYIGNVAGYSNLIIIQDSDGIITAYGNNKAVLVKLNDNVKSNQEIAQMGIDPATNRASLKFEVRKSGGPVNPLQYLQ